MKQDAIKIAELKNAFNRKAKRIEEISNTEMLKSVNPETDLSNYEGYRGPTRRTKEQKVAAFGNRSRDGKKLLS